MEKYHKKIEDLIQKLKELPNFSYTKPDLKPLEQELKDLQNSQLPRDAQKLESELKTYQLQQERNAQLFSQYADQKLKFAKRIIELEQEIDKIESETSKQAKVESDLKEELELLEQPGKNALFIELMKGFNVKGKIIVKPDGYETVPDDVDELWEKL